MMKKAILGLMIASLLGLVWFLLDKFKAEPSKQSEVLSPEVVENPSGASQPTAEPQRDVLVPKTSEQPKKVFSQKDWNALLPRGRELIKIAPKIGTPEWLEWMKTLSEEDRGAYLHAVDESRLPPEATQAEKDAVKIEDWKSPLATFPIKVVSNYRPLLRMEKGVSIRALEIDTRQDSNGNMISTMWARRANNSIVINWDANTVVNGEVDNVKSAIGPAPQYIPPGMMLWSNSDEFTMKINEAVAFEFPWKRKSVVYPLAMDPNYRYAFGMEKVDESKKLESIVVVDIQDKKVAGFLPIPSNGGLHCIFMPNDHLMVFDFGKEWIMMIDLRGRPMKKAVPGH